MVGKILMVSLTTLNQSQSKSIIMKNQVKASNFINWRFSDHEDVEDFGHVVVNKLMKNGSYSINARELFYLCGYIPQFICEDADGDEEYFPADLEFIDDITK